jgi:hypothetical protein
VFACNCCGARLFGAKYVLFGFGCWLGLGGYFNIFLSRGLSASLRSLERGAMTKFLWIFFRQ